MKENLKKIIVSFLSLLSVLCTTVYGNMTAEAIEESMKFYDKHKFLINTVSIIWLIMKLALFVFVIVIPIIIIYKKVKHKNNQDKKVVYIIATLEEAEVIFICDLIFTFMVSTVFTMGSAMALMSCIFNISISLILIGIMLYSLLKAKNLKNN